MSTMPSPLWGNWQPSTGGTNLPPTTPLPGGQPQLGSGQGAGTGSNPFGLNEPWKTNTIDRNAALLNVQQGQMKNQLAPQLWDLMRGYGGDAASFFKQLTDLGSPFYQRKQQKTAEQGSKEAQDAAGQARQQITATGAGYAPSGVAAAAFGGEAQAEAGNQEEAFLNNLFQNEQLQAMGASGMAQLASLFNPMQALSSGTGVPNVQKDPSFFQNFQSMMSSLFPSGGGGASGALADASKMGAPW